MSQLREGDTVSVVIKADARRDGHDVETGVFMWRDDNGDIALKQGKSKVIIPTSSISMILF